MTTPIAADEDLGPARRPIGWRRIVLWTVLGLLALLLITTLLGRVVGVHAGSGVQHGPPAPRPTPSASADMQH